MSENHKIVEAVQANNIVDAMGFFDDLTVFGPLAPYIADDKINDILINSPKDIFIEKNGVLQKLDIEFANDAEVQKIAHHIANSVGRTLSEKKPMLDTRLADGSRVNIVAPPLAVDYTSISIRKFARNRITLQKMAEQGNISPTVADILAICAASRLNIIVSGGTGAGKTTLLNALAEAVGPQERIVTIEDSAELRLPQQNVVRLETNPFDPDKGREEEVTIRDLVRNSLRMRPDRIVVGEVRGPEAFDMLQAMNTGHEGSMTTIHANHPRDCLARLENMVLTADLGMNPVSIRQQIASAINLVVQISRSRDGKRRITFISEVVGMEGEIVTMQDLFKFVPDGKIDAEGHMTGRYKWSGIIPRFMRRVAYWGYQEKFAKALGVELPRL